MFADKYDTKHNPELQGKILTVFVLISYLGCCPFFLLNAREYAKNIKYQEILTLYVAANTKKRIADE